jgi:uridine phosphorylase
MNQLAASELILNPDGSIYHLNLRPEQLANTVILVGDPERVEHITKHFDHIEHRVRRREFHTQTGTYRGKRMSVVSTGIGTDNIDIVLNELDALVNIDLEKREIKETKTQLDIVRVGTSGSIQKEIPVDAILASKMAVGFDSLLHYYQSDHVQLHDYNDALEAHLKIGSGSKPYVVEGDSELLASFEDAKLFSGFTATNVGFYAPQGRVLRLALKDQEFKDRVGSFEFRGDKITNLEMETSGIYGMSKLLGHRALSINAIIANRATGEFSKDAGKVVNEAITFTLDKLSAI